MDPECAMPVALLLRYWPGIPAWVRDDGVDDPPGTIPSSPSHPIKLLLAPTASFLQWRTGLHVITIPTYTTQNLMTSSQHNDSAPSTSGFKPGGARRCQYHDNVQHHRQQQQGRRLCRQGPENDQQIGHSIGCIYPGISEYSQYPHVSALWSHHRPSRILRNTR